MKYYGFEKENFGRFSLYDEHKHYRGCVWDIDHISVEHHHVLLLDSDGRLVSSFWNVLPLRNEYEEYMAWLYE